VLLSFLRQESWLTVGPDRSIESSEFLDIQLKSEVYIHLGWSH
jgi:hypothetical protein